MIGSVLMQYTVNYFATLAANAFAGLYLKGSRSTFYPTRICTHFIDPGFKYALGEQGAPRRHLPSRPTGDADSLCLLCPVASAKGEHVQHSPD